MLNGLDLFSGIGGLTLALKEYVRPVAYCEIDKYCQAVLLSNQQQGKLPIAPIWDDVRTLSADAIPTVDIIYGGFPCQDISVAGCRKGLAGERSGLFFEVIRLTREIRPQFIFLENVAGITAFLGTVAGELAALRYDCRWGMLRAYDMGAPHIRERWFCLAYANSVGSNSWRFPIGAKTKEPMPFFGSKDVADANDYGISLQSRKDSRGTKKRTSQQFAESTDSFRSSDEKCWCDSRREASPWSIEPNVGRVANGIPSRVDRLRGLGNAVVPQQAREAFERLAGFR